MSWRWQGSSHGPGQGGLQQHLGGGEGRSSCGEPACHQERLESVNGKYDILKFCLENDVRAEHLGSQMIVVEGAAVVPPSLLQLREVTQEPGLGVLRHEGPARDVNTVCQNDGVASVDGTGVTTIYLNDGIRFNSPHITVEDV